MHVELGNSMNTSYRIQCTLASHSTQYDVLPLHKIDHGFTKQTQLHVYIVYIEQAVMSNEVAG